MSLVTEFNDYRQRMNEQILAADNKVIKRFFNLDTNTYQEGAVDVKTKEMLGLACSMVLRCDDCIKYHLGKCFEEDISDTELYEVFAIANLHRRQHRDSALPAGGGVLGGAESGGQSGAGMSESEEDFEYRWPEAAQRAESALWQEARPERHTSPYRRAGAGAGRGGRSPRSRSRT